MVSKYGGYFLNNQNLESSSITIPYSKYLHSIRAWISRNRVTAVMVIILLVLLPMLFIAFSQANIFYRYNNADIDIYPVYERTNFTVHIPEGAQEAFLQFQFELNTRGDEFLDLSYVIYDCDLETFDANFNIEDRESMWEFRSNYAHHEGGVLVSPHHSHLIDVHEGPNIFAFWVTTTSLKITTWSLSLTLTLHYA